MTTQYKQVGCGNHEPSLNFNKKGSSTCVHLLKLKFLPGFEIFTKKECHLYSGFTFWKFRINLYSLKFLYYPTIKTK